MKNILIILLSVVVDSIVGQNLIPNPSFETYTACPTGWSQLPSATPWMNPSTTGSPDYYNQCGVPGMNVPVNTQGYQPAKSGVAYSGLYLWTGSFLPGIREYIEVPLVQPLDPGNCYDFKMYVNLVNASNYTTDNIGVYFSNIAITGVGNYTALPYAPQIINTPGNYLDSLNWTLVSGTYVAAGGETHIIIGNFNSDATTDTMFIYSDTYDFAYALIDDVSLIPCTTTEIGDLVQDILINVYPNPINDVLKVSINDNFKYEISIFDVLSKRVSYDSFTKEISIPTNTLSNGIYFYEIKSENKIIKAGKILK